MKQPPLFRDDSEPRVLRQAIAIITGSALGPGALRVSLRLKRAPKAVFALLRHPRDFSDSDDNCNARQRKESDLNMKRGRVHSHYWYGHRQRRRLCRLSPVIGTNGLSAILSLCYRGYDHVM